MSRLQKNKNPSFSTGVLLFLFNLGLYLVTWRCPTLTWESPTLPSALQRFTSEFGMVQVVPPHYRRQDNSLITCLLSFIFRYSVLTLPFTRSYWLQAESNFLFIESSIFNLFV